MLEAFLDRAEIRIYWYYYRSIPSSHPHAVQSMLCFARLCSAISSAQ